MWFSDDLWRNVAIVAAQLIAVLAITGLLSRLIGALLDSLTRRLTRADAAQGLSGAARLARTVLWLIGGVLLLAVLGVNGALILQGADLLVYYRDLMEQISPDFWSRLGWGILYTLAAVAVTTLLVRLVGRLLSFLQNRAKAYEQIQVNDESIESFFATLNRIQRNGLWMTASALAAGFLGFPPIVGSTLFTLLRIYLIVALGLLVVRAVAVIVVTLDGLSRRYWRSDSWLRYYDQLRGLIPLLRRSLEYAVYVVVATLVLLQVESVAQFAEWGPRLVQIIGIFFLARVAIEVVNLLVDRWLSKSGADVSQEARQRQLTLAPLSKSLLRYLVLFGAFVLILRVIGFDPAPVLAGAGLVTLIVGLGAQPVINDVVSGFFILFENLFLVGDYIETGSARGVVEAIDIRTTRLRDPDGQQHILRNGQLGDLINYSKEYTFAVVHVGVAYHSDLEKVYRVLREVGERFAEEHPDVVAPTEVAGLEDFGSSELLVRTVTRVRPGRHLQATRDLRTRIKVAFDHNDIEIPFPQRVLHFPDGLGPASSPRAEPFTTE